MKLSIQKSTEVVSLQFMYLYAIFCTTHHNNQVKLTHFHLVFSSSSIYIAPIPSLPGFTSLIKGFRRGEMTVLTGPVSSAVIEVYYYLQHKQSFSYSASFACNIHNTDGLRQDNIPWPNKPGPRRTGHQRPLGHLRNEKHSSHAQTITARHEGRASRGTCRQ